MIDNKYPRYTFSYSERLHLQKDFDRVIKKGRKMVHPAVFIYVLPAQDGSQNRRLGLITSSKVGIAVKRNLIKRRLREIFRLNKHKIKPGTDIVFILRKGADKFEFHKLEEAILSLLGKASSLI